MQMVGRGAGQLAASWLLSGFPFFDAARLYSTHAKTSPTTPLLIQHKVIFRNPLQGPWNKNGS